jgi:tetratricopeptide (TPR) repeat protein
MPTVSELLQDGYQLHVRGQLEDAAKRYRQILRAEPRNADVIVLLGMVRDLQRRHGEAVEPYDKAIRIDPKSPQAHYNRGIANRGIALTKLRRQPEAAPAFERAIALKSDLPEALGEYALASRMICD